MKYLFCTDLTYNPNHDTPDGERFLTAELPQNLQDALEEQSFAVWKAGNAAKLPGWLRVVRSLCTVIGFICVAGLVRATVPIKQAYHNAPAVFWVGGIALVIAGLMTLWEKWKQRKTAGQDRIEAAKRELERVSEEADACLGIPRDTFQTDILQLFYDVEQGDLHIEDAADLMEMRVFKEDAALHLTDGVHLYTLPLDAITELRLVEHPIRLIDWNKSEPPKSRRFLNAGVTTKSGEITGLRYCCALEFSDGGEAWSLLFPAYELPVFEQLTNLHAPQLPAVTAEELHQDDGPSGRIHPIFYWHPPKSEVAFWFTRESDVEFKTAHPVAYIILVLLGIVLLLGPAALFFLAVRDIPTLNDSYWALLGCAGGFVFGIALLNILAAWMQQYLGHVVTIVCIVLGSVMMAASWLLI